jgi:hypothetical protein
MIDRNDWRLQNQQDWLTGAALTHGRFQQTSEDFDHAHCEFCWAKFMDPEYRTVRGYMTPDDVLTEGYHTPGGIRWICNRCFEDFRDMFSWRIVNA